MFSLFKKSAGIFLVTLLLLPFNTLSAAEAPATISNLTRDMFTLSSQGSAGATALLKKAKERRVLMQALAKKDARAFVHEAIPASYRNKFQAVVRAEIEEEKIFSGKLNVTHVSGTASSSSFLYTLVVGDKTYDYYPSLTLPALRSDASVKLNGFLLGNTVVPKDNEASFLVITDSPRPQATGDQKTLGILVKFKNSPADPFTPEKAKATLEAGKLEKFYGEQSFGQVSFSADTTAWIKIASSTATNACGAVNLGTSEVKDYLATNNIDTSKYSRIVYLLSGLNGSCSQVGKIAGAKSSYSQTWIGLKGPSVDVALTTEMAYAFGLARPQTTLSLDAFDKENLGWLSTSTITAKADGKYSITTPQADSGARLVKLSNPALPNASLYTQVKNSDNLVIANTIKPQTVPSANNFTKVVAPQKSTDTDHAYVDEGRGIVISDLTKNGEDGLSLNVEFSKPVCKEVVPSASDIYPDAKIVPSISSVYGGAISFKVVNNDYPACKAAKFKVSATLPGDWSYKTLDTLSVEPGGSIATSVVLYPPYTTTDKTIPVKITITRGTQSYSFIRNVKSVVPPVVASATGVKASPTPTGKKTTSGSSGAGSATVPISQTGGVSPVQPNYFPDVVPVNGINPEVTTPTVTPKVPVITNPTATPVPTQQPQNTPVPTVPPVVTSTPIPTQTPTPTIIQTPTPITTAYPSGVYSSPAPTIYTPTPTALPTVTASPSMTPHPSSGPSPSPSAYSAPSRIITSFFANVYNSIVGLFR